MKVLCLILALSAIGLVCAAPGTSRAALDEEFGYVTVRDGAHMFWVAYHVDQEGEWTDYPLILWLQGGPGSSGVGYGNFEELGPYYVNQTLRETAWTKKANLMFIDNPVGTGYSYVDDIASLSTTNAQIATDLVEVLKAVFTEQPDMQVMPFYIFAESYGGKMTVDTALALNTAILSGEIVCNFKGVGLGDSWISPMDSVNTWGTFLYHMGFVDSDGQASIDAAAAATQAQVDAENWESATDQWGNTEVVVSVVTNGVDFYNVLATEDIYKASSSKKHLNDLSYMRPAARQLFERHVLSREYRDDLSNLMDGEYHDRWGIPDGVTWGAQGGLVFNALYGDFMRPVVDSVVELLDTTDLYVAVYSGNLDLICDTPGTYRWIENMQYSSKPDWDDTRRENFYVSSYSTKAGYVQNYQNFGVYTVLRSGHMVPTDAPIEALALLDLIFAAADANSARIAEEKSQKKLGEEHSEKISKAAKKTQQVKQEKKTLKTEDKKVESAKMTLEKPQVKAAVKAAESQPKTPAAVKTPKQVVLSPETKAAHKKIPSVFPKQEIPRGQKRVKRTAVDRLLMKKPTTFGL